MRLLPRMVFIAALLTICQGFCANVEIHEHGYWNGTDLGNEHCFDSPLASALVKFFNGENAKSVVDFGCGTGDYVKWLRDHGIHSEGYDGNPDTPKLSKGIAQVIDLSQPFDLGKQFDWVLSLEVGEHLPPQYERTFIENLHRHSVKGIVLSWAVRGQGGLGHVNEQNNEYIKKVMAQYGYFNDVAAENTLREESFLWWFEKSIMVFRKK